MTIIFRKIIPLITTIFVSIIDIYCQDKIYIVPNQFSFQALFIKPNGDTLSKEFIHVSPLESEWKYDKSQKEIKYFFNPDTIGLTYFINPVNKRQKKRIKYPLVPWIVQTTTGFIENGRTVWWHPFRDNQYIYTEIAPFPEVFFDSLGVCSEWNSELHIMFGWDNFKGVVNSKYTLIDTINDFELKNFKLKNCSRIEAIGTHSVLGKSTLTILYDKSYGFLLLDYLFYDGTKIQFKLIDVINKQN